MSAQEARTCANCACSIMHQIEMAGTKQSVMMCRLEPPIAVPQRVSSRVAATSTGNPAESMQMVLTYKPTAPELVCWQWKPQGTLPGDNPVVAALLPTVEAMAKKAGIKIPVEFPVGLSE